MNISNHWPYRILSKLERRDADAKWLVMKANKKNQIKRNRKLR